MNTFTPLKNFLYSVSLTVIALAVIGIASAQSSQPAYSGHLNSVSPSSQSVGRVSPSDTYSYTTYFPVIMGPYSIRFSGRVLEGGSPVAGVTMSLFHCKDLELSCFQWETLYTTTNTLGQYVFYVRPNASAGTVYNGLETYQVSWNNTENNPNRLRKWYSRSMRNDSITSEVALDDFELSDVKLLAPTNDILSNQPVRVQWIRRNATPWDSYRACVYWPPTGLSLWAGTCSDPLGYVDSYTLTYPFWPGILYHAVIKIPSADGSTGESFVQPAFMMTGQPCLINSSLYFADVNGDGKTDAIAANSDGVVVRRSNGTQFLTNETWASNPSYGTRGTYFADVTGDGKADMIVVNAWGVGVRRSDGTQFLPSETWQLDDSICLRGAYEGCHGLYVTDVTGDGKADLIEIQERAAYVHRSDGSQFLSQVSWTLSNTIAYGSIGTYLADVTGDGETDEVMVNDSGVIVRRSDGTQFLADETWTTNPFIGTRGLAVADVTGDGKADLIAVNDSGVTVRRSDGTQFLPEETWTANPYYGDRSTDFTDVTGDGKADAIVVNDSGVTVRRSDGTQFLPNETWTANPYYGAACLTNP